MFYGGVKTWTGTGTNQLLFENPPTKAFSPHLNEGCPKVNLTNVISCISITLIMCGGAGLAGFFVNQYKPYEFDEPTRPIGIFIGGIVFSTAMCISGIACCCFALKYLNGSAEKKPLLSAEQRV